MELGGAGAIVFGKHFVSVPNLPDAFRHKATLPDNTYYGGGEKGYIDYPTVA